MVENDLPLEARLELRPLLPERVVEPTSDSAGDDLHLLPPESPSREQLSQQLEPPPEFVLPPAESTGKSQFSIGDVMVVMIGVAVGLAGGTWMPPDVFAAMLGLVTLLGLLLVHVYPPESHLGKLLWATLVLAYVMAVFAALLRPVLAGNLRLRVDTIAANELCKPNGACPMKSLNRFATTAALAACLASSVAYADVKLPKIFGDSMVLQQKTEAAVWGWADPGEEVTVSLGDAKASGKADADGKWQVKIATPAAGGPLELKVKGKNELTLKDVLVGEVWICSGQSNMEMTVGDSNNSNAEAKLANYPTIRMIKVAHAISDKPETDFSGKWQICTPETAPNFSAVGHFFARDIQKELNVPVGMISTNWGGTICEAWASKEALAAKSELAHFAERGLNIDKAKPNPNQPTVLFNGMINPLVPYGIRGALWYQGESNRNRGEQYRTLFPAMIADWRARFGQGDFSFLFVQLAPYTYGGADPRELAEVWEAQLKTLSSSPNTGMAVTTDIGNLKDIHPKNKQEVGRRLALWALAKTYNKSDLGYSGPLYESMAADGNKVRLKFQHTAGGLVAEGGKPLSHFTIAGEDQKFVPATAEIDGETVVVSAPEVAKPVAVRFAWDQNAEPNFFNKAGLPASPFRTDDWPLVSVGRE